MNCQEVMDYMQRELDGDLNEQETAALAEHILHCSECSAMYERLQHLSSELENLPRVTPAYSLVDAILPELDRIDAEGRGHEPAASSDTAVPAPRSRARTRRWTDRFSYRALAGAVAAGVVAGIFLITYQPQSMKDGFAMDKTAEGSTASSDSAADAGGSAELKMAPSSSETHTSTKDQNGTQSTAPAARTGAAGKSAQPNGDSTGRTDKAAPAAGADSGNTGAADVRTFETPSADAPSADASAPDAPASDATAGAVNKASNKADKAANDIAAHKAEPAPTEEANAKDLAKGVNGNNAGDKGSPTMGIQAAVSQESISPDQAYKARITDGVIAVDDIASGETLFESGKKTGMLAFVAWSEDSKSLEYKVTADNGEEQHYVIDVIKKEETPKTPE